MGTPSPISITGNTGNPTGGNNMGSSGNSNDGNNDHLMIDEPNDFCEFDYPTRAIHCGNGPIDRIIGAVGNNLLCHFDVGAIGTEICSWGPVWRFRSNRAGCCRNIDVIDRGTIVVHAPNSNSVRLYARYNLVNTADAIVSIGADAGVVNASLEWDVSAAGDIQYINSSPVFYIRPGMLCYDACTGN